MTFLPAEQLVGGRDFLIDFDPLTGAVRSRIPIEGTGPAPFGLDLRGHGFLWPPHSVRAAAGARGAAPY